jgi:hypothetical protein
VGQSFEHPAAPRAKTSGVWQNMNDWIHAFSVLRPEYVFSLPPAYGYGNVFEPTPIEQDCLRNDFDLTGQLEAKWKKNSDGSIHLFVREKRPIGSQT